jgi:hypothetical protein
VTKPRTCIFVTLILSTSVILLMFVCRVGNTDSYEADTEYNDGTEGKVTWEKLRFFSVCDTPDESTKVTSNTIDDGHVKDCSTVTDSAETQTLHCLNTISRPLTSISVLETLDGC